MTSYGGQAEASLPHWGCDVRNCRHLLGFWEGQRAVTSYGDQPMGGPAQ